MSRRLLALLVVSLALPALATAADTDPQKRYTAADVAKARSLVLKRPDLVAGWKQEPGSSDSDSDYQCAGYDPDYSDLTETGEAESEFSNGQGAALLSYATLMRSPAEAAASWRRGNKPAFARCLAEVVTKGISEGGAEAKVTSYGRVPFPRLAQRVAAFKVTFTVKSPQVEKPVAFTLQLVVLGRGRAEVALMAMAPFNGGDLKPLATVLARRLAAAKV